MKRRYASRNVPWDHADPPPEVLDFVPTLSPGRALDLGCGYGRASIFLARLGWQVDGVDFVPQAIAEARRRAEKAGVTVNFHVGDVTRLDFLTPEYTFALDVGCAHNLTAAELAAYAAEVRRLLAPGGYYMLTARIEPKQSPAEPGPRGITEAALRAAFAEGFALEWVKRGIDRPHGNVQWQSGWFRFRRAEG